MKKLFGGARQIAQFTRFEDLDFLFRGGQGALAVLEESRAALIGGERLFQAQLAGFHALNYSMFELAHGYARTQMSAFVELQQKEFAAADKGFTAVKHQREVGVGYFDAVTQTIEGGQSSTTALTGSTEEAQFDQAHETQAA